MALWQIAFDWFPWLLFVVVVFFMMRFNLKVQSELRRFRAEQLTELRRHSEQLERIARALDQRPPA